MDIVREAGLSTGAVYGRFRSKNDLLREAVISRSRVQARVGVDGVDRAADLAEGYARRREAVEPLVQAALADGTVDADVDPEAVLFFVRTMHAGLLLHRGSGLDGPDPAAWAALVERVVASFGRPDDDEHTNTSHEHDDKGD